MINRNLQILLVYFKNSLFLFFTAVYLLTAICSKYLFMNNHPILADEITTTLFIVTLWLLFHFGLILKRQFANHRASLLPRYRKSNLVCVVGLYILFAAVAVFWDYRMMPTILISEHAMQGIYALCLLCALGVTYMGYLSMGRIFIYFYVVFLVMALNTMNIIAFFEHSQYFKYLFWIISIFIIFLFAKRLMKLKEDHFEYDYLLAWPPRKYMANQVKASQSISNLLKPVSQLFGVKETKVFIPKYPRKSNLLTRAWHWDYTEHADLRGVWLFILLATPIYVFLIKQTEAVDAFFKNGNSNFLLLSVSPVIVALGSQYKKMAYWGYDILKPVKKENYILERGVILFFNLISNWILFIVCLAVIPNLIFHPQVMMTKEFIGYITLTGSFAFLLMAWICLFSCVSNPRSVLINGVILSLLVVVLFSLAPILKFEVLVFANISCLLAGGFLSYRAFSNWRVKEFN